MLVGCHTITEELPTEPTETAQPAPRHRDGCLDGLHTGAVGGHDDACACAHTGPGDPRTRATARGAPRTGAAATVRAATVGAAARERGGLREPPSRRRSRR